MNAMAILAGKNEAGRAHAGVVATRLWLAAGAALIAHFALGALGISLVERLILLFAFVVLGVAGLGAYLERERH